MAVAVWDTYVKKKDGSVIHFDILVPDTLKNEEQIFEYGREYLNSLQLEDAILNSSKCQFCHIEEAQEDVHQSIISKGYHIIPLHEIPAGLPIHGSRRDFILYLRAYSDKYRFADLRSFSIEDIQALISSEDLLKS